MYLINWQAIASLQLDCDVYWTPSSLAEYPIMID